MSDDLSTTHALESLKAAGFHVEPIPANPLAPRADIHARYGQEEYVIEAKHKEESREWLNVVEQSHTCEVHNVSRRVVPWGAIASVVKGAVVQLAATPASAGAFRLLWIVSLHEDDGFVMECIKGRLFGVETVSVMEAGFAVKPCFYHGYSDFRLYPELDGAVLSVRKGSMLCVNSFSPRREHFTKSRLYKCFQQMRTLCDPLVLEKRCEAFVIGSDFTAKPTGTAQWEYLREKYGVRTTVMQRSQFDSRLTVPLSQNPDTYKTT